MNLDELRTVQSKERQKDSLQHLRPSFYQEVADYIFELKEERERVAEAADDPFSSPEVGRLTDEIETAKDVVEAIYERRMGKLVKQASLAAAGMPANDEGLTAEEQDLFEDLISRIESNKGRVLDVLEGSASSSSSSSSSSEAESETASNTDTSPDSSADRTAVAEGASSEPTPAEAESGIEIETDTDTNTDTDTPSTPPRAPPDESDVDGTNSEPSARGADTDSGVSAADVMGGDVPSSKTDASDAVGAPSEADSDSGSNSSAKHAVNTDAGTDANPNSNADSNAETDRNVDRVTVRITRDVGSILGVDDREYTLSSDDVVTLPEQNATPLVERDAAEQLE